MHYILVVVTTMEILLLAVSFLDDDGKPFHADFTDFKNATAFLFSEHLFKVICL